MTSKSVQAGKPHIARICFLHTHAFVVPDYRLVRMITYLPGLLSKHFKFLIVNPEALTLPHVTEWLIYVTLCSIMKTNIEKIING